MSPEVLSALAAVGTFVVITVTAIAALVQLRHLRSNNQLQALIDLGQQFERVSRYYSWVYHVLPEKMKSPEFRSEIGVIVDPVLHPELIVASFFDQQGMIVKHNMMHERLIMEYGGGADVILRCWTNLRGVIAIRRERAPSVYQNFEYLAMRAQKWLARFPKGNYPSDEPRMPLDRPHC